MGGHHCHIDIQEEGTYIYSHLYAVLRALVDFFEVLKAANMVEGPVNTLFLAKEICYAAFCSLHHPLWDYGIVFGLAGEFSFYSWTYPGN